MGRTVLALVAVFLLTSGASLASEKLKGYNVDVSKTTVSGLSSGAFMAHQLHIAHSDVIQGAAILAGGPYYCAEGRSTYATGRCTCFYKQMSIFSDEPCDRPQAGITLPSATRSLAYAQKHEKEKLIADLSNLKDDKVFLMLGDQDQIVLPQSMTAVKELYGMLGLSASNITNPPLKGNHTFPTLDDGNACSELKPPYIGDCDLDVAGHLLQFLIGDLKPKANIVSSPLIKVDQKEFVPGGDANAISLDDEAYLFVPAACEQGQPCRLHVALHGCGQSADALKGDLYPRETGYLDWAETNNIIVLFPQTVSRFDALGPMNPNGCWDWWGYDGTGFDDNPYGTRKGPQIIALRGMIDRIGSGRTP